MIEKIILDYLKTKLDVDDIYMEMPKNKSTFIIIEKTGSYCENLLFSVTVAIQSYSTSLYSTSQLNEQVKNAMASIQEEVDSVCFCSLNSDYNYTDTETKQYRYQSVFDLKHY